MFIIIWIALSIANNTANVPEWLLISTGFIAMLEAAWYIFIIIIYIIGAIMDRRS